MALIHSLVPLMDDDADTAPSRKESYLFIGVWNGSPIRAKSSTTFTRATLTPERVQQYLNHLFGAENPASNRVTVQAISHGLAFKMSETLGMGSPYVLGVSFLTQE